MREMPARFRWPRTAVQTQAAAILLGLSLLFVAFATTRPWAPPRIRPGHWGDIVTQEQAVSRLRAGEPYYQVIGNGLRRGGYGAKSVFNWRTPLLWRTLGAVPDLAGRAALVALALCLLIATLSLTTDRRLPTALSGFMQTGTVVMALGPGLATMGELWAGILIGLSAVTYARQRYVGGALLGLLGLFVRELAAPICVVWTLAALWRRRWLEFGTWCLGACAYAAYFAWHLLNVQAHRQPTDLADASSWLQAGGLPSLLSKAGFHMWLLFSPNWATALALVLVCAGIVMARTPTHVRLAGAAYVVFFLLIGKPFNNYWGLIAWPLWSLACGYGLQFVFETWAAATARPKPADAGMSS